MPGPLLFSLFALVHGGLALAALALTAAVPAAAALFVVEAITAYDNLIIALGNRMGPGPRAEGLNRGRFFLHATCIGLLVPVYVGIGAAARVSPFDTLFAMPTALLAAVLIGLFGYFVQYRAVRRIMPCNYFGCLRYVQAVDERRRLAGYEYSEAELAAKPFPPFASIITVLLGLLIALRIGWVAGLWVPFVVTALMFTASAFPARSWGPLLTSALEIFYSAGLVYTLWQLAGA